MLIRDFGQCDVELLVNLAQAGDYGIQRLCAGYQYLERHGFGQQRTSRGMGARDCGRLDEKPDDEFMRRLAGGCDGLLHQLTQRLHALPDLMRRHELTEFGVGLGTSVAGFRVGHGAERNEHNRDKPDQLGHAVNRHGARLAAGWRLYRTGIRKRRESESGPRRYTIEALS